MLKHLIGINNQLLFRREEKEKEKSNYNTNTATIIAHSQRIFNANCDYSPSFI